MAESTSHLPNSGTVSNEEPLLVGPPDGVAIEVVSLNVEPPQVGTMPTDVSNWECFDGALLAVCIQYGDRYVVEGTAVMIGLGLALTAKHIFDIRDKHRDPLQNGEATLRCLGIRPNGGLDIWQCYAMSTGDDGDLELLSLMLLSDWPDDGRFSVLPLTTRIPTPGEALTIAGFGFGEYGAEYYINDPAPVGGLLYVSQGAAGEFSYPIHDSSLAPFPTIEIFSGSLGGMSGGAALDANGHVVGITSLGFVDEGPTLAAWWVKMVFARPQLNWPPGIEHEDAILFNVSSVEIVGRDNVELLDEPNFTLRTPRYPSANGPEQN